MKTVLEFLRGLRDNNTREWFEANRKGYELAKAEFEFMLNRLIPEIYGFDPGIGTLTAKDCVFRIYRDVRFSKDKSSVQDEYGRVIFAKGDGKGFMRGIMCI